MKSKRMLACLLMLFAGGAVTCSSADENKPAPTVESHLQRKKFLQTFVNMQVQGLTEQYKLTADQAKTARQILLREDWKAHFHAASELETFDRDIRKRIAAGNEPSSAEIQTMAAKLAPLCQQTLKNMMLRTLRIHRIMTPDQQRLHQKEIDEMETDSAELNNRLARWKAGGLRPGELTECFGPESDEVSAARQQADSEKRLYSVTSLEFWDMYVRAFIEAFQLDAGQIPMAYSVLNDTKALARAYRKDHEWEFAQAERELEELRRHEKPDSSGPGSAAALADRPKRIEKLNRPLLELFEQLKARLMKIPTENQRRAALDVLTSTSADNATRKQTGPASIR